MPNPQSRSKSASSEDGAVLVEYALMLLLIAIGLIFLITIIGNITLTFFGVGGSL